MSPTLTLDTNFNAGPIDRRIFSGFLEHLGRSVYEGIYDPGNPLSDAKGFRRDVVDALKPMRMPLVRWPGGNFVSSYEWTDGIGPRANRPARPDFAWKSVEPNQIGVDEFCDWCELIDSKPMMAVNLGTAGAREAAALVEYCNLPRGTYWADRRAANGHAKPHAIKLWCLGNEMDGPWQAGQVPADEYARRADQAGKMMKGLDPSIELVLCGSSGRTMPTYMDWDRVSLEYCWNQTDYISAHRYSGNRNNDSADFLAEGVEIDRIVQDYRALIGYVQAIKRSSKRVGLSFDEWNVWYKNHEMDGKWKPAPHLLEEIYNLEDALVCAQYLTTFIRNADVVKVACLAQLVNVIAPILTRRDGVLIQSIYHPFVMLAQHTRGVSLTPRLDGPTYKAGKRGECPALDASVSYEKVTGEACVTIVNRDAKPQAVDVRFDDRAVQKVLGVQTLAGKYLKAANSWTKRNVVTPKAGRATVSGGKARMNVPGPGMIVVRLATRAIP